MRYFLKDISFAIEAASEQEAERISAAIEAVLRPVTTVMKPGVLRGGIYELRVGQVYEDKD